MTLRPVPAQYRSVVSHEHLPMSADLDSRRGWIMVAAAATAMFTVFGVGYSFGAFFTSITDEFQAGSGATATVFGITIALSFVLGQYTGAISDRVGPKQVLRFGAFMLAAGLLITTIVPNIVLAYIAYGVGVGTAIACGYVPMVAVVGGWFDAQRALALGVAVAGIGLGTLVGSPLAATLISAIGWRAAFVSFAIGGAAILLGASFVIDVGPASAPAPRRRSLRELWGVDEFRILYLSMASTAFGLFVPFVFIAKYAQDRGTEEVASALLVGLIGGASIGGRLALGVLATRVGAARLFRLTFAVMALSQLIWLASGGSYAVLVVFAVIYGTGYGGFIALSPAVAAARFGLADLGGVLGTWYTAAAFGALLGPPFAGELVDRYGFNAAIVAVMIAIGIGWVLLLGLEQPS